MLSAAALPLLRLILVYISGVLLATCYPMDLFITLMLLLALSLLYLGVCLQSSATAFAWLNPIGLLLIFLIGYSNLLLQVAQQKQLPKWGNQHLEGYTACIQKVYHPLSCKAFITHIKDDSGWHNSSASIQLFFLKNLIISL